MAATPDPQYTSTAATYLRWVLEEFWSVTLYVDNQLRGPAAADRDERAIWLPPGLELDTYRSRLTWAWHYIQRGPDEVPGFHEPTTADPATSAGAVIIPFQRAPIEEQLPALEQPLPDVAT